MWIMDVSMPEKVLRSVVVYTFLVIVFRITGKRQVGQLTPFDLVVLLIVSNALQNALIGPDNSVSGGLVGAVVIFVLNGLVAHLSYHSRWFERLVQGEATPLLHDGHVRRDAMRRELITHDDLHAALRDAGMVSIDEARFAVLEANGKITCGRRH
jgi:uncharacterized membrane protein YcaP (DUF421 family)